MSLCYVLRPPARHLSRVLLGFLLAVPVLSLAAFLPISKSTLPFWRTALENEHGIHLGNLLTAQPLITFEAWVGLTMGLLWLIYCLGQNFGRQENRVALQFFTLFIALLAMIAIGLLWSKREIPLWRFEWAVGYFGPFPNRNHFGGLLAIGAVMGFAATYDAIQRRRIAVGCTYALCVIPMFAAMLLNTSRMGVLLFFAGLSLWMGLATSKRYTKAQVAVALSILLLLASGFILFGNTVISRVLGESALAKIVTSEGRIGIYLDTLRMISLSPWRGVGLGNFEPVFSMTRETMDTESRALHPESDWLWLTSETGLPCILCALIAAILLAVARGPWSKRGKMTSRGRRLAISAAVAALIFPAQSLVDTPLHGIGPASLTALLIGLAGIGESTEAESQRRSIPGLWPGLGLAVGGIGLTLCITSLTGSPITHRARFAQLSREAARLKNSGDHAAALQTWNKAAALKPLQWNIYYERAALKLAQGYSSQEALADFSRSRYLEQTFGRLRMSEAELWFQYDPPYAIPALREAMERDPTRAFSFYGSAIQQLPANPELRPAMRSLATAPSLQFLYLSASTGDEFTSALKEFLARHPTLEGLKGPDRLRLFQLWYERGSAAELIQQLDGHPDWLRDGWPVVAEHQAKQGNFEEAYKLAMAHTRKPSLRPRTNDASQDSLRRLFLLNPQDPLAGLDLYWAQKMAGNRGGALATLREVVQLKNAPPAVHWEMAAFLAEDGDYLHAWSALQEYLRRTASGS
ncbi:O-antigen ligase family protein [Roseimicrobium sp. ORNL1]|nr:O-antigen ligase family protein [Roseimicrobium sp. ORNL1]